jgi:succinate dehydrogenase/fumarate reductase flavoprotein subunit
MQTDSQSRIPFGHFRAIVLLQSGHGKARTGQNPLAKGPFDGAICGLGSLKRVRVNDQANSFRCRLIHHSWRRERPG